uniref:Ovule protein n=1 Tax=Heterorhabditis bacteriophora TaxID=37862 RepID=A0A1I7WPQ8_HETBA
MKYRGKIWNEKYQSKQKEKKFMPLLTSCFRGVYKIMIGIPKYNSQLCQNLTDTHECLSTWKSSAKKRMILYV